MQEVSRPRIKERTNSNYVVTKIVSTSVRVHPHVATVVCEGLIKVTVWVGWDVIHVLEVHPIGAFVNIGAGRPLAAMRGF